jgi:protein-S-isoprenylcysteine O-methyltransferase Ste14
LSHNLLVIGIITYPLVNIYVTWHPLSTSSWGIITGLLLVLLGRILSFGAMVQLRKNPEKLHNDGYFKWTRNPNIDGTITFLIGMWVLMPSIIFFSGCILVFIYLRNRAKLEEKFLLEAFGKQYLAYKNGTRSSLYI